MVERFIFPRELPKDSVSLYSIWDLKFMESVPNAYGESITRLMEERACQGFGINWWENNNEFMQIFLNKVATIYEMNNQDGYEDGGFCYECYKTPISLKNKKVITDGFSKGSDNFLIPIGKDYHSSRYYIYAREEAMCMSYFEAKREAKKISERLKLPLEEFIDRHILFTLETDKYLENITLDFLA
jgi:hypothetical protein